MKESRLGELRYKWRRAKVKDPVFKEIGKMRSKRERKKAYLLFSVAILIAIAYTLLYVLDSSWLTLINPLAVIIIIVIAIWMGVLHLGTARIEKRLW